MHKRSRERGAALFVGLMILIIMSLIAVTGMQTTTMQERMAANFVLGAQSFNRSEVGNTDWEQHIVDYVFRRETAPVSRAEDSGGVPSWLPWLELNTVINQNVAERLDLPLGLGSAGHLVPVSDRDFYRITSMGIAGAGERRAVAVVQEVYVP